MKNKDGAGLMGKSLDLKGPSIPEFGLDPENMTAIVMFLSREVT